MKIYIYARVSTKDEQDPENQLLRLREWAERSEHEIVGEYIDRASGANQHRPGLDEMMDGARKRYVDAIVIVRLDRICRSMINLTSLVEIMDSCGISLICLDQDIDMTTAAGRLLMHLLGAIAQFERELIRDRVKDGMERARRSGKHLGRPRREIDEDLVWELYYQGMSKSQIAEMLDIPKSTLVRRMSEREG